MISYFKKLFCKHDYLEVASFCETTPDGKTCVCVDFYMCKDCLDRKISSTNFHLLFNNVQEAFQMWKEGKLERVPSNNISRIVVNIEVENRLLRKTSSPKSKEIRRIK